MDQHLRIKAFFGASQNAETSQCSVTQGINLLNDAVHPWASMLSKKTLQQS